MRGRVHARRTLKGLVADLRVNISGGTTPYTAASKDDKIATTTVKDAKLTIKGVKVGSTTITITDKNKKTATVVVTVTK